MRQLSQYQQIPYSPTPTPSTTPSPSPSPLSHLLSKSTRDFLYKIPGIKEAIIKMSPIILMTEKQFNNYYVPKVICAVANCTNNHGVIIVLNTKTHNSLEWFQIGQKKERKKTITRINRIVQYSLNQKIMGKMQNKIGYPPITDSIHFLIKEFIIQNTQDQYGILIDISVDPKNAHIFAVLSNNKDKKIGTVYCAQNGQLVTDLTRGLHAVEGEDIYQRMMARYMKHRKFKNNNNQVVDQNYIHGIEKKCCYNSSIIRNVSSRSDELLPNKIQNIIKHANQNTTNCWCCQITKEELKIEIDDGQGKQTAIQLKNLQSITNFSRFLKIFDDFLTQKNGYVKLKKYFDIFSSNQKKAILQIHIPKTYQTQILPQISKSLHRKFPQIPQAQPHQSHNYAKHYYRFSQPPQPPNSDIIIVYLICYTNVMPEEELKVYDHPIYQNYKKYKKNQHYQICVVDNSIEIQDILQFQFQKLSGFVKKCGYDLELGQTLTQDKDRKKQKHKKLKGLKKQNEQKEEKGETEQNQQMKMKEQTQQKDQKKNLWIKGNRHLPIAILVSYLLSHGKKMKNCRNKQISLKPGKTL